MTLDISILKRLPELNKSAILEIDPLAPLSMVSDSPGSYYKTLKAPNKKILSGLFENLLGWHIDLVDRNEIVKELKKSRKKLHHSFPETEGSSYSPLLLEYFELQVTKIPFQIYFDDYWSRSFRRADAIVHPNGTFNIDYTLIPVKRQLLRADDNPKQPASSEIFNLFRSNLSKFPLYYSTPTKREYLIAQGKYEIKLKIDSELLSMLLSSLQSYNIAYLGHSEGWVDINLYEI